MLLKPYFPFFLFCFLQCQLLSQVWFPLVVEKWLPITHSTARSCLCSVGEKNMSQSIFWYSCLLDFFCLFVCFATRCGMWNFYTGTCVQSVPPAVEEQSLNHWTTKEVPVYWILLRPMATPEKCHSQGELNHCRMRYGLPWWLSSKSEPMQETRIQSLAGEGPLEKEMATHSIILAWEIPWTEEPDGLQSIGS